MSGIGRGRGIEAGEMKEGADWEDTTTVLLSMVGAIGAWLWLQSIGAGILAFVVLLVGIARLARKGEARNWAEWEHTVKRQSSLSP